MVEVPQAAAPKGRGEDICAETDCEYLAKRFSPFLKKMRENFSKKHLKRE
jgi:hypothetical protein